MYHNYTKFYNSVLFNGNVTLITSNSLQSAPPVYRAQCIEYCTQEATCSAIFVAYDGSSVDWCVLLHVDVSATSPSVTAMPSSDEPWQTLWNSHDGAPASSELYIYGLF